jgi:hypothetical protein
VVTRHLLSSQLHGQHADDARHPGQSSHADGELLIPTGKIRVNPDADSMSLFDHGRSRRYVMRTLTKPGRPTLPPPQPIRPPAARTFVVRCTTCGRRFEVDRAPAPCPACGGVAIAV